MDNWKFVDVDFPHNNQIVYITDYEKKKLILAKFTNGNFVYVDLLENELTDSRLVDIKVQYAYYWLDFYVVEDFLKKYTKEVIK